MTLVKLCGMTREEDVSTAIELGVSALGFVLWPTSPRHVSVDRAARLIRALPADIVPVGVFVSPSRDEITRAVNEAGIQIAQLHGAQEVLLDDVPCGLWMAASLSDDDIVPQVPHDYTVLLDAPDPDRHGGTGRTIDWRRAAHVAARRRVVLAGGLTPSNVAAAIRAVRPYGVDVASGLEQKPGVKDAHAMRAFVAAVREADH